MYIVSACLLGANCKYNGGNNDNEDVKDLCEGHRIITVCPETEGGLQSPRPPAEQVGERVIDREGKDLTDAFTRGAEICLNKVLSAAEEGEEPELAILKANSPSCGSCRIYDGTFSGTLTDGDGVYPEESPEFDTAFVFLKDTDSLKMVPSWAYVLKVWT